MFLNHYILIGFVCAVSCVFDRKPPDETNRIPNAVVCKAYCVHKYMQCFKKFKCHRPEMKYRIPFCKERYDECYTTCTEELFELDYDENSRKKLRKIIEEVKPRRGRPPKKRD